jgi:cytochrome P450
MEPHSFLFGHLLVLRKLTKDLPNDMHLNYIPHVFASNWKTVFPNEDCCPGLIYADLWPLVEPLVYTVDGYYTHQALAETNLPKSTHGMNFFKTITENKDLNCLDGAEWRLWRNLFNTGFSQGKILALVPSVLKDLCIFRDKLLARAGDGGEWGGVFPLQDLTRPLAVDVVGRAVLDLPLLEQTKGISPLFGALMDQVQHSILIYNIYSLPRIISPIRNYKVWRNRRIMRKILVPLIQRKMARLEDAEKPTGKTVLDLAARGLKEEKLSGSEDEIMDFVVSQLKLFLFGGYDTSSGTICWCFHTLMKNPEAVAKVRAEHDAVFGLDPWNAPKKLSESPHLLNQLPYTTACIKESTRIYSGFCVARNGTKDFSFTVPGSVVPWPTDGFSVYDAINAGQRWEKIWPRANEFIPERFLVGPDHELTPPKNAWRLFGLGPRNCIAMELAIVEIKLALVLVLRVLEMDCAWEEWDVLQ